MGKKSKKPSKQAPKPKAAPAVPPAEAVPQASAQIYSAHKTISVYQGTEDGVATFGVATYLRYAKADADRAEEPRHDLSLSLAEADAHTALLSESAEGAISSVVASLSIGDRVELEWLQMRLGLDAAELSKMVRTFPTLLGYSIEDNIEPKLGFYEDELGLSPSEVRTLIVSMPARLGYSLKTRLRPRLEVCRAANADVSIVLRGAGQTDAKFCKRVGVPLQALRAAQEDV